MGVSLIFRIAAVGILVSVICQVLKRQRQGGAGVPDKPGRPGFGTVLDGAVYL